MTLSRGFERAEFETRAERAQALMAARDIDALLLTTEPEVRYFSGFLTPFWQSPARPWFLVVPRAGEPVAVIPEIGVSLMQKTWVCDIRGWPSPRPADEGVSLLVEVLAGINTGRGRIGVPMGPETMLRMPLADYARLREGLPETDFIDATEIVRSLRMVKSEAEIARIAEICRIVSDGFDAVPQAVRQGDRLSDVFAAFRIDLVRRGADQVPYLTGGAAPGGYADIIAPPEDRPLAAGDLMMMDTGAVRDGYFADFDRNFAIGPPGDGARKAYRALYAATEAGLAAARPGALCADVFAVMARTLADDGYDIGTTGRFGHGIGMQLTEWPSISRTDSTPLAPGMALALEPCLTIAPGCGMVHEENIVIRDEGPELLSRRACPELPVIGA